ncbi:MAG: 4-hydroxythreonine-4-phosphate dehydrogenase PdxA [Phycisphaeraceae bacterium]|nr:MAG: 4-hydroxythreonine-4-phosphate dehydrogenase PdxA [Phycisphaeraceae bacterium]
MRSFSVASTSMYRPVCCAWLTMVGVATRVIVRNLLRLGKRSSLLCWGATGSDFSSLHLFFGEPASSSLRLPAMSEIPPTPDERAGARRPTIGVTMGDPLGVGAEVVVKALADPALRRRARFMVYGMAETMHYAADLAEIEPYWWRVQHDSPLVETAVGQSVVILDHDEYTTIGSPGAGRERARSTRAGGEASFRFVEHAIRDAKLSPGHPLRLDAVVTAPISKQSWAMAGRGKYPGHTELFATRFNAKRWAMMFISPRLRVILATAHVPLMDLRNLLTLGRVFDPIDIGNDVCRGLGIEKPRIAVCGLNPHAGEGGLFGDEETRVIEPAIRMAQDTGIDVRGPFPADTIFISAARGEFDLVVAMYHDQGLIPVKLLEWERAVNVTAGLPIVRTSPDHGTAFDIAGANRADARSMRASLDLAIDMAMARQPAVNA